MLAKSEYAKKWRKPFLADSQSAKSFLRPIEADLQPPYLPPKAVGDPEYTLVLDLDETLIHTVAQDEQLLET